MSYGDTYLRRIDDAVDDEYQANVMHRAAAVGARYNWLGTLAVVAALGWILPGEYALWGSVLAVLPLLIGSVAETSWMKKRAPRPRALRLAPWELVVTVTMLVVWMSGIWFHGASTNSDLKSAVSGCITGVIVVLLLGRWLANRVRVKDEARLDAELED